MKIHQKYPILTGAFNNFKIRVIENGLLQADNSWFHSDVVSSYNRLYFIIEGNGYLQQGEEKFELCAGQMYLIPCKNQYTYACSTQINKFYIHFDLQLLPGLDLFESLDKYLSLPFSVELLSEIIAASREETPENLLRLNVLIYNVILEFIQLANVNATDKHFGFYRQKALLEYIEKHLSSELKIQEISKFFSIPYHKLSKDFKTDTGFGLKAYIDNMLLQKAKELLLCSELNISEIARELKFCDAYYFSRFFRKYEKMPPKDYRNLRN